MVGRRTQLRRATSRRVSLRRVLISLDKMARYPLRRVLSLASQKVSKAPPCKFTISRRIVLNLLMFRRIALSY